MVALYNKKYKVIEYLLDKDMVDIKSCCKRSPISSIEKLSANETPQTSSTFYATHA